MNVETEFTAAEVQGPHAAVVELAGDLRGPEQPALRRARRQVLDAARRLPPGWKGPIVLDLGRVSGMDSAGVAVLLELMRGTRDTVPLLRITGLTPRSRKIFQELALTSLAPVAVGECPFTLPRPVRRPLDL